MTKKSQTTGLPKSRKSTDSQSSRTQRGYRSRAERDAVIQRYVIIGTIAAIVIIVLIVGGALVYDQVISPARTVATVNGEKISASQFEKRVRFERALHIERISAEISRRMDAGVAFEDAANATISIEPYNTYWSELNVPDQLGLRVLNAMIDDQLILAEAERRGITVSPEDIETEKQRIFSFDTGIVPLVDAEQTPEPTPEPTLTPTPFVSPTPSLTPSPTLTPEAPEETVEPSATPFPTIAPPPTRTANEKLNAFEQATDDFYSFARAEAGYSQSDVDEYFRIQAIRHALATEVVQGATTETWVNARHILVETEETARDIIEALQSGESFADLAAANGTDGTASRGGELGWAALAGYVAEFADAIKDAPVGDVLPDPVQSQFGYHVVQINAREERDVDNAQVEQNLQDAFDEWLQSFRTSEGNEFTTSNIWPDHVPDNPAWRFRQR